MFEQFFPFPAIPVIALGLIAAAAVIANEIKHYRFKRDCAKIDAASPPKVLAA